MTIPELITEVLDSIRRQFYAERTREFKRDERALLKAISKWGYECAARGWDFRVEFIAFQFRELLMDTRKREADIKYLPVYLEGAVKRWIGQRAEELQLEARKANSVASTVKRIEGKTRAVEVVRERTNTEVLAAVYQDLRRRKVLAQGHGGATLPKAKQEQLL